MSAAILGSRGGAPRPCRYVSYAAAGLVLFVVRGRTRRDPSLAGHARLDHDVVVGWEPEVSVGRRTVWPFFCSVRGALDDR